MWKIVKTKNINQKARVKKIAIYLQKYGRNQTLKLLQEPAVFVDKVIKAFESEGKKLKIAPDTKL